MIRELPGEVLIALRRSKGYMTAQAFARKEAARRERLKDTTLPLSAQKRLVGKPGQLTTFAGLTGWSYSKLNRLERIRRGFAPADWRAVFATRELQDLVDAGWIEEGDEWYVRFEESFKAQARALYRASNPLRNWLDPSLEQMQNAVREVLYQQNRDVSEEAGDELDRVRVDPATAAEEICRALHALSPALFPQLGPGSRGILRDPAQLGESSRSVFSRAQAVTRRTMKRAFDVLAPFVIRVSGMRKRISVDRPRAVLDDACLMAFISGWIEGTISEPREEQASDLEAAPPQI